MHIKPVSGSAHDGISADGWSGNGTEVESDKGSAIVAASVDRYSEALAVIAGDAGVPRIVGDALQVRSWLKAQVAHGDVGFVKVRVDFLDGLDASLFAAGADTGLHAQRTLVLRGGLVLTGLRVLRRWGGGI